MNLLDENFPENQCVLLRRWGIHVRQIGREIGEYGADDEVLIPLLHRLKGTTFFTHDQDFFEKSLAHPTYCLVWLDVDEDEMATYARRFLRHTSFATKAQRMGIVVRVGVEGLHYWQHARAQKVAVGWVL